MSWAKILRSTSLAAAVAGLGITASLAPAHASERQRDRIYADSFGNLVVYSRAGFKRIVVGQGHLAAELNAYSNSDTEEPRVVRRYDDEAVTCYQRPYLWKGRSYMYGLPDGEIPQPPVTCSRE